MDKRTLFADSKADLERRDLHPFIEPMTDKHLGYIYDIQWTDDNYRFSMRFFDDLTVFIDMQAVERAVLSRIVSRAMRLRGDGSTQPIDLARAKLDTVHGLSGSFRYLLHPQDFETVWAPILRADERFTEVEGAYEGWRIVGTFRGDPVYLSEVAPPDMMVGILRPDTKLCQPAFAKPATVGVRGHIPLDGDVNCETLSFIIQNPA